jgi:hypothetical protein
MYAKLTVRMATERNSEPLWQIKLAISKTERNPAPLLVDFDGVFTQKAGNKASPFRYISKSPLNSPNNSAQFRCLYRRKKAPVKGAFSNHKL